eukprot:CAMPEP_0179098190 /NCGR_PEP_ID=MMETSP0796-20121207/45235_1 /TAXON_ID=73915 /ORGANISM="Pyrodinium bahamense, Strain pbaha01" /LENGTH=100 /DNA_ID=CAMNT_0020795959 /DNA_START=122 /DNA_END=420 /DNA_ORIENTATION=+
MISEGITILSGFALFHSMNNPSCWTSTMVRSSSSMSTSTPSFERVGVLRRVIMNSSCVARLHGAATAPDPPEPAEDAHAEEEPAEEALHAEEGPSAPPSA